MTIFKYPVQITNSFIQGMPEGAAILCVQNQHGRPMMWAAVNEDAAEQDRVFYVRGTGHPTGKAASAKYVGTFQQLEGDLVFHLFDGGAL